MGQEKIPVMVKMRPELHEAFIREIGHWTPAIQKAGPMGEMLISVGISVFNAGMVRRTPQAVQDLLRKTTDSRVSKSTDLYPWHGIARSKQEADDFVAMVMDEIVGGEPRRAVGDRAFSDVSTKRPARVAELRENASAEMPTPPIPNRECRGAIAQPVYMTGKVARSERMSKQSGAQDCGQCHDRNSQPGALAARAEKKARRSA